MRPQVLKDLEFDWQYMMRGLVIDKVRGNILKVDRHKYVKLACHGFRVLSRQERLDTYASKQVCGFSAALQAGSAEMGGSASMAV